MSPASEVPLKALHKKGTACAPGESVVPTGGKFQDAQKRSGLRLLELTAALAEISTHRRLTNGGEP